MEAAASGAFNNGISARASLRRSVSLAGGAALYERTPILSRAASSAMSGSAASDFRPTVTAASSLTPYLPVRMSFSTTRAGLPATTQRAAISHDNRARSDNAIVAHLDPGTDDGSDPDVAALADPGVDVAHVRGIMGSDVGAPCDLRIGSDVNAARIGLVEHRRRRDAASWADVHAPRRAKQAAPEAGKHLV